MRFFHVSSQHRQHRTGEPRAIYGRIAFELKAPRARRARPSKMKSDHDETRAIENTTKRRGRKAGRSVPARQLTVDQVGVVHNDNHRHDNGGNKERTNIDGRSGRGGVELTWDRGRSDGGFSKPRKSNSGEEAAQSPKSLLLCSPPKPKPRGEHSRKSEGEFNRPRYCVKKGEDVGAFTAIAKLRDFAEIRRQRLWWRKQQN